MQLTRVAVLVGSKNDKAFVAENCLNRLADTVGYDFSVCSADRNREDLPDLVNECLEMGIDLFICYAGLSPALPRAVAAIARFTPVIGVCKDEIKGDQQAITNTPPGLSVIYVGAGKEGLIKAAEEAMKLLGWKYPEIHEVHKRYVEAQIAKKQPEPHEERVEPKSVFA